MSYRLHIYKHLCRRINSKTGDYQRIIFAVVNEKKGDFPINFVCNLPKNSFKQTIFRELFQDPETTAKSLLKRAKKQYTDVEIQREIDIRLATLEKLWFFIKASE